MPWVVWLKGLAKAEHVDELGRAVRSPLTYGGTHVASHGAHQPRAQRWLRARGAAGCRPGHLSALPVPRECRRFLPVGCRSARSGRSEHFPQCGPPRPRMAPGPPRLLWAMVPTGPCPSGARIRADMGLLHAASSKQTNKRWPSCDCMLVASCWPVATSGGVSQRKIFERLKTVGSHPSNKAKRGRERHLIYSRR